MTKITELEKTMLKAINKDYSRLGIENTEFYNTFGYEAETNKELRGAFASLKRKKIVDHTNDPNCFNPIYPTRKFIEIMHELGEEVDSKVEHWVRFEELMIEYNEEYERWMDENNGHNWTEPETGRRFWQYPFERWLKETHNIEF